MVSPPPGSESEPSSLGWEPTALGIATPDDVPRLAAVLADAFMQDPVYTWMVPGSLRLRARLRTMFAAEMEQYVIPNGGTIWTTAGYDAAVCELPPGGWEFPRTITTPQALKWVQALGRRFLLAGKVQSLMEERHIREPHLYVRLVGVRSALQGQGIGSALMQGTLARADSAGVASYIEASSERSAALYERLGFVHLGSLDLPDGGPPVWPMRRPPAGARESP